MTHKVQLTTDENTSNFGLAKRGELVLNEHIH